MSARKKTKAAAVAVRVPQDRGEAAAAVARIGELNRQVARIEADMNDRLTAVKAEFDGQAQPLRLQIEGLTEGVKVWAEANRRVLTNDEKVKFADLGTGKVSWRHRPPSVTIRGVEAVLEAAKRLGLQRFIRTKEEPNREAMLNEADVARTIPGVTIGSAGEEFIIEPFEAELAPASAAGAAA